MFKHFRKTNISLLTHFNFQEPMEVPAEAKEEEKTNQIEDPEHVEKSHSPVPGSHESALEEDGIDHMDFEEISDEELEEEIKVKGLGDALGVDWASLVAESRPRVKQEKSGSAKKRWESLKVLSRVGLSLEMAGEKLIKEILKESHDKEKEENKSESEEEVKKEEVVITHPVAAIQVAIREKEMVRNNLFATAGTYRRALSARRDLAIRRHLCGLPIKDLSVERPKTPDGDLFEQAKLLALRCL